MFVAAMTIVSHVKTNALPLSNYMHMCLLLGMSTTVPLRKSSLIITVTG
jgi:hypothetical protein